MTTFLFFTLGGAFTVWALYMNFIRVVEDYKSTKEYNVKKKQAADLKEAKINLLRNKIINSKEQYWFIYSGSKIAMNVSHDFSFKLKLLSKSNKYEIVIDVLEVYDSFGNIITEKSKIDYTPFYDDKLQIKLTSQNAIKRTLKILLEELIYNYVADNEAAFLAAKQDIWIIRRKHQDAENTRKTFLKNEEDRIESEARRIKLIRENARKKILWKRHWFINDNSYDFKTMSGLEFEKFVGKLYEAQGFEVSFTPATGDFGVDIVLTLQHSPSARIAIQAKNYSYPVGVEAIQQVYSGMMYYGCTTSMVVTNSTYTSQAIQFSEKLGVELINGKALKSMYVEYEEIIPSYNEIQFSNLEKKGLMRGFVSEADIDLFITKPHIFKI